MKLKTLQEESQNLINAVFYTRNHKNIFHQMRDEVTQLKANHLEHQETTNASLFGMQR